jgi:hypothetical protein
VSPGDLSSHRRALLGRYFLMGPLQYTRHTTPKLCAGPGTLSLARLIRRNNERIRLQECRPAVVDVSLHDSKEIVDLRKNTLDTSDNEALKVLLECAPPIYS